MTFSHQDEFNCGFLAREVARLDKALIHRAAMQRYGNWTEQLNYYCPESGLVMDDLISTMLDAGFDIDELRQLETLSNADVLRSLPRHLRFLQHNVKSNVITYLRAWGNRLEYQLEPSALHDISARSTEPVLSP